MKRMIIVTKIAWYGDTDCVEKLINIQDADQTLDEFLADSHNQVDESAYQLAEDGGEDEDS